MHLLFSRRSARIIIPCGIFLAVSSAVFAQVAPAAAGARALPGRIAATERRTIVEGLSTPLQDLQIIDLNGRDVSDQMRPRTEGGKLSLDFTQRASVVLKSRQITTLPVPNQERVTLPGGVIVPRAPSPDPGTPDKPIWLRLTFAASPMPAPWDNNDGTYTTLLTFGLKRPDGAPPTLPLDQPVIVKLGYHGLTAPEVPPIAIAGPGLEHEKSIALRFNPQTSKPTLLVRSSLSDVNLELTALPRLVLQPARKEILGLGLEVVNVAVANVQPEGRLQPVARDTPVMVQIEGRARATAEAPTLKVGQSNTQFAIRSAGLGPVTIQATADGVAGVATLRQLFPTGPLLAALIGGALGGFARRFVKGARRSSIARRVMEGVVVATVVFVAGVLGVGYLNLPAAVVATEAGAFLTAALGGFVGVTVFETLAKKNTAA